MHSTLNQLKTWLKLLALVSINFSGARNSITEDRMSSPSNILPELWHSDWYPMQNLDHSADYKTAKLFVRLLQHHRNKIVELVWSNYNIPVWNGTGMKYIAEIQFQLRFEAIEYLHKKFLGRPTLWTEDAHNRWSFCQHFPRSSSMASESTKSFPSSTGPNIMNNEILTATGSALDLGFCVQIKLLKTGLSFQIQIRNNRSRALAVAIRKIHYSY